MSKTRVQINPFLTKTLYGDEVGSFWLRPFYILETIPVYQLHSRLGGVVVSVLTTGPKGHGFEPGQGDGFLMAIKIRSTPSSRMGSKAGSPMS
jgi:hypothetical protein